MNRSNLRKLPHVVISFVILLHSLERWETGHDTYIIFLLAGLVFLGLAVFHRRLSERFPRIDYFFYVIEGVLSFIIAWEYVMAGKKGLPYMYSFAGLMQFFALYLFTRKKANR